MLIVNGYNFSLGVFKRNQHLLQKHIPKNTLSVAHTHTHFTSSRLYKLCARIHNPGEQPGSIAFELTLHRWFIYTYIINLLRMPVFQSQPKDFWATCAILQNEFCSTSANWQYEFRSMKNLKLYSQKCRQ